MGIWLAVSFHQGDLLIKKPGNVGPATGSNLTRVVGENTSHTEEIISSDEKSDGLAQIGAPSDNASQKCMFEWTGEQHDDSSNCHKFYRVTVNDTVLTRHWGRAPGYAYYWDRAPLTKEYETNAEAIAAALVITHSKLSRGYVTVNGPEEEE